MNCPDCEVAMTEGFLPDVDYGDYVQSKWHPGKPRESKFLGLSGGVKVTEFKMVPLTAFRCGDCGLVRLYALHG